MTTRTQVNQYSRFQTIPCERLMYLEWPVCKKFETILNSLEHPGPQKDIIQVDVWPYTQVDVCAYSFEAMVLSKVWAN